MKDQFDALIVGAGISGLALAQRLLSAGHKTLIAEKSKGVGGRIATRRDGAATYDHGAQFYKVAHQVDWDLDKHWSQLNLSHTWFEDEKSKFKCAAGGLTRLAKDLAKDLEKNLARNCNILFQEKVVAVDETSIATSRAEMLAITCESGNKYFAKKIYFTSPLPQTLDVLRTSKIQYPKDLELIEYASALVGLFEVSSPSEIIENLGYDQNVSPEIFSISNQLAKKTSSVLAFTVVMQPDWSAKHFDGPEESTLSDIQSLFSLQLNSYGTSFEFKKQQLKKWRFSHPTSVYSAPHVEVGLSKNVVLLGDAFGGPSILGAVRSAESITVAPH